jgi:predicted RNA binding protein YcfA (HicA-like mRNA interferase family)
MAQREKALERICRKPPAADVTWDELTNVMCGFGYEVVNGRGSRRKFYNRETDIFISCHEPHGKDPVDKGCLKEIVEHLKDRGLI